MRRSNDEKGPSGRWEIVQTALEACRQQLSMCERTIGAVKNKDGSYDEEEEEFKSQTEYLGHLIRKANVKMQLLIERTGYAYFLAEYNLGFKNIGDLSEVRFREDEPYILVSNPLNYVETAFTSLVDMVIGPDDKAIEIGMVERALRNAPYIVKDFKANPHSEKDIKATMLSFLKHLFADARHEVKISHVFKTYKADIGIESLKTLIEVKYAQNEKELKAELDGVYADMKGYAGDDQWLNFFALIYTTEPITTQERIDAEYALAKVDVNWRPIIVHGTGDRIRPAKLGKEIRGATKKKEQTV